MNLIILDKEDIHDGKAEVTGKKLEHILTYLKPSAGDTLKTGLLNGLMGEGIVMDLNMDRLILKVELDDTPPAPLPLILILAMPRPKVLNRVVQHAATMGIKEIYIIKTWRVEKSYLESPILDEDNLRIQMILGLEQGKDTILPKIKIRKLFKPFIEDELPMIIKDTLALVLHPLADAPCPHQVNSPVTIAIGPEGGFIPYEIDALQRTGFKAVSLGERILRVETALPFIIGRLF
ncbi:MAG: 16S rRNA (uracil(1498)-N(3))-methyltransferase [Desulfatiglans sp.]|jgi:RsmE family RNA methyltransferase|nr:16S rRNA (uracil(1498)-N(3))-methyltransferase [Desulfatiglans sp.]